MVRGWARLLSLPFLLSVGCDGGLAVNPNDNTIIQMVWSGSTPTADGQHLELWARDQYNDIIRVDGTYLFIDAKNNQKTIYTYGLQVRPAITLDDPCMIDSKGNLVTTAAAYPTTTTINGVTQTPAQQAQQVVNRIAQVTQPGVGTGKPLYVVVPYVDAAVPSVPADSTAAVRLAICQAYWAVSPLTYTPNPAQLTAPIHGAAYGFITYTTQSPAAGYDGIRIDSPSKLKNIRELWVTTESVPLANVDVKNRGPVFTDSTLTMGGNDVEHFDLTGPGAAGAATLINNLDDSSVIF